MCQQRRASGVAPRRYIENRREQAIARNSGLKLSRHVGTRIGRRGSPKTSPAPTPPRAAGRFRAPAKPASTSPAPACSALALPAVRAPSRASAAPNRRAPISDPWRFHERVPSRKIGSGARRGAGWRASRTRGLARLGLEVAGVVIDKSRARHHASNRHPATFHVSAIRPLNRGTPSGHREIARDGGCIAQDVAPKRAQ